MLSNTHLLESYQDRRQRSDGYSQAFLAEVTRDDSAWSHEARLVIATAARLGIHLDEESLILSDVRDLQALRNALDERLGRLQAT
jgi:hypothetical protein